MSVLSFKNMRQRVDFAYDNMDIDIFYEGDYHYTLRDNQQNTFYEMIDEDDLDDVLSVIWLKRNPPTSQLVSV